MVLGLLLSPLVDLYCLLSILHVTQAFYKPTTLFFFVDHVPLCQNGAKAPKNGFEVLDSWIFHCVEN